MNVANATEAVDRMWFVAREHNLPYTALDAIEEVMQAVDFYDDWQAEKSKLEDELYDLEEKAAKLEAKIIQLEKDNEQLQERIDDLLEVAQ